MYYIIQCMWIFDELLAVLLLSYVKVVPKFGLFWVWVIVFARTHANFLVLWSLLLFLLFIHHVLPSCGQFCIRFLFPQVYRFYTSLIHQSLRTAAFSIFGILVSVIARRKGKRRSNDQHIFKNNATQSHLYIMVHTLYMSTQMRDVSKSNQQPVEDQEKLEKYQRWVFLSTFMNYAMAHWTRKYALYSTT